jgi:hypothetical protein
MIIIIIFSGSAAQRRLWPPRPRGFLITHKDAPQSVRLLWTSNHLVAGTSTWQHSTHTINTHAPGGIRTLDRSRRSAVGLSLSTATGTGIHPPIEGLNHTSNFLFFKFITNLSTHPIIIPPIQPSTRHSITATKLSHFATRHSYIAAPHDP